MLACTDFDKTVWACSLGQALIFTGEAIAVILGGNLASAFKIQNISWRAAPLGLAVTAFLVAFAIAVFIREPKKGRFIVQVGDSSWCKSKHASGSGCDGASRPMDGCTEMLLAMPRLKRARRSSDCGRHCPTWPTCVLSG